jgi:glycosyltransferase involved in cell wall biosynthesis
VRAELGIPLGAPLLVYAGSVGPQYRFDLIADLAGQLAVRGADARLLVLSGSPDEAQGALAGRDDLAGRVTVMRAAPNEVPRYLAAADVGAAFRTPTFSTRGVAPVKLSEYLLCGVPVVGTAGIGDTQAAQEAGMFFDDTAGMPAAAQWVADTILPAREQARRAARAIGVERFSLRRSVEDYLTAIKALDLPED